MLQQFKLVFSALLGLGTIAIQAPAQAIPYQTNTIYKTTENGQTAVYFSAPANSTIVANLGSSSTPIARLAGNCGEVRIPVPTSGSFAGLTVDGSAIDASTLPVQTLPSCVNGSFVEPRTSNFKLANGSVVIVGRQPSEAVTIALPQSRNRSIRINACGFGRIASTASSPLPTSFTIGTTEYTIASLTSAGTAGPICRTVGGISQGYRPATW